VYLLFILNDNVHTFDDNFCFVLQVVSRPIFNCRLMLVS